MRVIVHPDRCVGAGQCVFTAPDVFDQREEDGMVVALTEQPDDSLDGAVREAADLCPAQAIQLAD